ncbi:LysR family transcriptional regulator [Novosphingobium flavum]|uniref:LysR family transcriptional regulator n=1 Tax=Novosphingobium flavum TaxID=1778672 RepID=A0A7X1FRN2_9SPHN|nr:LysR family transcriptional regulator [Novosphingobium flavum]MBC2665107.1 LysR family transcriptional regulator [Novosphingobium flavum]
MSKLALHHFETLLWIARLGTFRAAAERLNTTQPAISARVREIETQLGTALFRREGRGVVLTARGRQLVQDCEPLLAGFERVLLEASGYAGATGVVRIGAGEIAAATCLPAFVAEAKRDLPGVTLDVTLELTARMLQNLFAGTLDLVFLAGPVADPALRLVPLGGVKLVWLASPAVVAAGGFGRPLTVWSLGQQSPLHRVMRRSLERQDLSWRSIDHCSNVQTIIQIVAAGTGAALLPETMARRAMAEGALVEVLEPPAEGIEFQAAVRADEGDPLVLDLFERASRHRIG